MSISASWIVLAVLLLRLLLKKAPKWIRVLLWGIVGFRLICPFSFESALSLIPNVETISSEIMMDRTPTIDSGVPIINNVVNPIISQTFTPAPMASANPLQIWIPVCSILWTIGVGGLFLYTAISYWRVKKRTATAIRIKDNIFQSESVISPFVLGIINPNIYLPFYMNDQDAELVISHEQAHIQRKDHLWKPLGFLILCLHWFNPLMWLGYILLCRDIELACDEKVIQALSPEEKADYSQALLTCSVNRRTVAACPLAFGEVNVKDRIKSVLHYRKPAFWVIALAITASIAVAVCFLTNPPSNRLKNLTGTLENIHTLWTSDGNTYDSIGAVSQDLLEDLAEIKISHYELSLSRSEDRDKTHTLVLQTKQDAEPTAASYLKGLYIHFSADFQSVWINDGVKPTFSYKIINPKKAKTVYEYIEHYNVSTSVIGGADRPTNIIVSGDFEYYTPTPMSKLDGAISVVLSDQYTDPIPDAMLPIQSYEILASESLSGTPTEGKTEHFQEVTLYLLVYHMKYTVQERQLEEDEGAFMPTVITFAVDEYENYTLRDYWTPEEGDNYEASIRAKFPGTSADEALNTEKYAEVLMVKNWQQATELLSGLYENLDAYREQLIEKIN